MPKPGRTVFACLEWLDHNGGTNGALAVLDDGSITIKVADDVYSGELSPGDAHKLVNAIERAGADKKVALIHSNCIGCQEVGIDPEVQAVVLLGWAVSGEKTLAAMVGDLCDVHRERVMGTAASFKTKEAD